MSNIPNILSIAGSDSSGGAGIQADLKTFSALNVYGATVITNITAQNSRGVQKIHTLPIELIKSQLVSVFEDINITAVKIGMLHRKEVIELVADTITHYRPKFVIVDPVSCSTQGQSLLESNAVQSLKEKLFPLASMITPNIPEALSLLEIEDTPDHLDHDMITRKLSKFGAETALLKGGHMTGDICTDVLLENDHLFHFSRAKIITTNTHGTGCTLSSAIASFLSKGNNYKASVDLATNYISTCILNADKLSVGSGTGPLYHFR